MLKFRNVNLSKYYEFIKRGKNRHDLGMNYDKPEFQDLFSQTISGPPTASQHSPLTTFFLESSH